MKKGILGLLVCALLVACIAFAGMARQDILKAQVAEQSLAASGACAHGADEFCSHLPVVSINTRGQQVAKEFEIWVDLDVVDHASGNNHPSDTGTFSSIATAKYRGNSSYSIFDKRSYRVELHRSMTKKQDYDLFGMGAHSDWVFSGPFLDRSLLRNRLMFILSGEVLPWAPDTRYFELFVDGAYQGLYLAIEPISNGPARLNLTEFSMVTGETAYIVGRERSAAYPIEIETYGYYAGKTSYKLHIAYPGKRKLLDRQQAYIVQDINRFEEALYSDDFDSVRIGYSKYVDVDSFVHYFLINELASITDATKLSTYAYKNIGGKLTMTVWDFNNGFDNYPWYEAGPEKGFYVADGNWFDRMLEDRAFTEKVVNRYRELRETLWTEERLIGIIDAEIEYLGDAIDRNFEKYGYTFMDRMLSRDANGLSRDPTSYEEAVRQLKANLLARLAYLDREIESLYERCIN